MRLTEDRVRHLAKLIMAELDNIEMLDYITEPNDIRLKIIDLFNHELEIDEKVHKQVMDMLRNSESKSYLMEGTPEWKAEYEQHYQQEITRLRGFGE